MTYQLISGVAYGDHPRLTLDIHRPVAAASVPIVVFFHGGAWRSCNRDDPFNLGIGRALAATGLLTIIPNYRLYPDALFPAFVEDGARALAWAIQRGAEYGGDVRRVVIAGFSAGAHIAALLGHDAGYLRRHGLDFDSFAALCCLSGFYEFDGTDDPYVERIFSPAALQSAAQPARLATAQAPPTLLVHGMKDGIVKPEQTLRMAGALTMVGARSGTMLLPDHDHHSYITEFSAGPDASPVLRALHRLAVTGILTSNAANAAGEARC